MADDRYTKYVTKNTGQLETMLKVILAPDVSSLMPDLNGSRANVQDPPEGFVQNYCLLIGDRSFSNFQKVRIIPSVHLFLSLHLMPETLPYQPTCYPHHSRAARLAPLVRSLTPDPRPKRYTPKRPTKTPRHLPLRHIVQRRPPRLFIPNFNRYGPNPL